jgi:hypothetical protein
LLWGEPGLRCAGGYGFGFWFLVLVFGFGFWFWLLVLTFGFWFCLLAFGFAFRKLVKPWPLLATSRWLHRDPVCAVGEKARGLWFCLLAFGFAFRKTWPLLATSRWLHRGLVCADGEKARQGARRFDVDGARGATIRRVRRPFQKGDLTFRGSGASIRREARGAPH